MEGHIAAQDPRTASLSGDPSCRVAAFPFGPFMGGMGYLDEVRHTLPAELDHRVHAMVARATGGFSLISLIGSYLDWAAHLLFAPGKQLQIALKAWDKARRFSAYTYCLASDPYTDACCIEPLPQDRRFDHEGWASFPFNFIHQQFLLTQQWWHNVFTDVPGVRPQHEALVDFTSRQFLDIFSPGNFYFTNPVALQETISQSGHNLVRGALYFWDDMWRVAADRPAAGMDRFRVGENLATTPGKVVYRNRMIELIQYTPTTEQVYREPVLIIPAWIMKYYILDLSKENSLVRYLTSQGYTVFMVSWRNPTGADRDLGMEDYLQKGVFDVIDAVRSIVPDTLLHLTGYCLGGTLAAIGAAALSRRDAATPLASLTLLAAQVDFEDAGELSLFISDSQLAFLDDLMWEQGYLDKDQMGGAFQILRSNDLFWSRILSHYWLGDRRPPNDLMAWNADGTRMPYRMHSEYLRSLYLRNDLAEGRFEVGGDPVSVSDIKVPVFAVATTRDHVAPWHSVYKLHILADTDITFLLTKGGHNAGIVSEPGHKGRSYKAAYTPHGHHYIPPEIWEARAEEHDGSWWPAWTTWLTDRSTGAVPARTPARADVHHNLLTIPQKAPGTYVFQQ